MRHFCTYFDQHYLLRGLALHQSLAEHCASFQLWILCMDDVCYDALKRMDLPAVSLISLAELEDQCPRLLEAKKNRTRVEYYFTCTPALPLYVLSKAPKVEDVTYLDADLFFFADPAPLYQEIGDHSIAIIEHRFPPELGNLTEHGIYNVGFVFFRHDEIGLACLRRWLEQCLEWCYDRIEDNRYGDQKYLDDWPKRFESLLVMQHKGANLAPWNLARYAVDRRAGNVRIDGQELIVFHFHGLYRVGNWLYEPNLARYKAVMSRAILSGIYKPYLRAISKIARDQNLSKLFLRETSRESIGESSPSAGSLVGPGIMNRAQRIMNHLQGEWEWRTEVLRRVYRGRYILFLGGPSTD
jgi:hypothetical protein